MISIPEYSSLRELSKIMSVDLDVLVNMFVQAGFSNMDSRLDEGLDRPTIEWVTDEMKFYCQVVPDTFDIKGKLTIRILGTNSSVKGVRLS